MDSNLKSISYRLGTINDLEPIAALEAQSYPEDEAASRNTLQYRLTHAPHLFQVCILNESIIGFICATASVGNELTHDTMFTHNNCGGTLCVHSVVIDPSFRRKGIASGYTLVGESKVVHGEEKWYELKMDIASDIQK